MKIEKLNENQIRCTLSRKDLEERHIKLSELAYGSEKAKSLFRDMIRKAGEQFGFQAGDIPLMVEAIPANPDTLVLVISKVEYPDELDTRFSKFSEPDEEYFEENENEESLEDTLSKAGASDILDLFRQMKKGMEPQKDEADTDEDDPDERDTHEMKSDETESDVMDPMEKDFQKTNFQKTDADKKNTAEDGTVKNHLSDVKKGNASAASEKKDEKMGRDPKADYVKVIRFASLDQAERLAHVLSGFYKGKNDLYRISGNEYYLFLHKNTHTPEAFNKICNIASEYAEPTVYTELSASWFEEHGKLVCKDNALQMLAEL